MLISTKYLNMHTIVYVKIWIKCYSIQITIGRQQWLLKLGMEQTIPLHYFPVFHPEVARYPALNPKSLNLGTLTLNLNYYGKNRKWHSVQFPSILGFSNHPIINTHCQEANFNDMRPQQFYNKLQCTARVLYVCTCICTTYTCVWIQCMWMCWYWHDYYLETWSHHKWTQTYTHRAKSIIPLIQNAFLEVITWICHM